MLFLRAVSSLLSLAVICCADSESAPLLASNENSYFVILENIVIRPVAINEYFSAATILNIGGIMINIDTVPTSISTIVTGTFTQTQTSTV